MAIRQSAHLFWVYSAIELRDLALGGTLLRVDVEIEDVDVRLMNIDESEIYWTTKAHVCAQFSIAFYGDCLSIRQISMSASAGVRGFVTGKVGEAPN